MPFPEETEFDPVRLIEAQEVFKEIIPGVELFEYPDTETIGFRWVLNVQFAKWQLVAINSEEAKQRMRIYAEQTRHKAIRELGLEPILEGMRQEVRDFRNANEILDNIITRQKDRITYLENRIEQLENPELYGEGQDL